MANRTKFTQQNTCNVTFLNERWERLTQKNARRATIREDKRRRADAFKDEGNKYFRDGRYADAIKSYERAVTTYGPRLVYINNLAAAYIKVERFGDAEYAAEYVLMQDPKQDKARYRRALARKGQEHYKGAATDLMLVIRRDPTCEEAIRELEDIRSRVGLDEDNYYGEDADTDVESLGYPLPSDEPLDLGNETPFLSETSDFEHEGNGTPCRDYNHEGCKDGEKCKLKHAPDSRSIRDKMGRNVCVLYVYGNHCYSTESECPYAHDWTFLPKGPWTEPRLYESISSMLAESPGVERRFKMVDHTAPMTKPTQPSGGHGFLPHVKATNTLAAAFCLFPDHIKDKPSDPESHSKPPKARGKPKVKARVRGKGKARATKSQPSRSAEDAKWEKELETRMKNFGFTEEEVLELASQGVNPWDEDACDVLDALQGY